jgi:hypothetical protein
MIEAGMAMVAVAAMLAGAAIQLVLALAGYRAQGAARRDAEALRTLRRELQLLQADHAGLLRRLATLEQGGAVKAPAPIPAALPRAEPYEPAYELAGKLARKGASATELMDTCGLSRGEVELIALMNQGGTPPAAGARRPALATA